MSTLRLLWTGCLAGAALLTPTRGADPLATWTPAPSGVARTLQAIVHGADRFVVVGRGGTALTSASGLRWLAHETGQAKDLYGVAYGQGLFVAVGESGALLTSTNGVRWTSRSSGTTNRLQAVTATPDGFVAVGRAGTIVTSSDGVQWTSATSPASASWVGVGAAFGRVFIGSDGSMPNLFWSETGSDWTTRDLVWSPGPYRQTTFQGGFAFGGGVLLGLNIRGVFSLSSDGRTWTNYLSNLGYCQGLAYGLDQFVAVGGPYPTGQRIASSPDGLRWQVRHSQAAGPELLGVAFGRDRFVAVGAQPSGREAGVILVSGQPVRCIRPARESGGLRLTFEGPAATYRVQASSSLTSTNWQDIAVATNVVGSLETVDPDGLQHPMRFYRAVAE
jgi:hypothetical protein